MGHWEVFFRNKLNKLSRPQKALFISVFISGFFAHGYMFANNFTYHDAILQTNGLGATFNLGRFVLGLMEILGNNTIGVFAVPLFHGIVSLLFIAVSGMLVIDILHVRGTLSAVYTGVLMAVFPVVASIFAFMYTSGMYWFALFLNVTVVWLLSKKRTAANGLAGIVLLITALGIYQAYFTVAITLFLLSIIVDLLEDMEAQLKDIIMKSIWYLAVMFLGLIGYLVLNRIAGIISGVGLSSYQGMDKIEKIEFLKLPAMIGKTYYYFLADMDWCGINGTWIQKLMIGGIVLLTVFLFIFILFKRHGGVINRIVLTILILMLPMGLNGIYLMSSSDNYSVHALMRYSLVFTFIVPVILLEKNELLHVIRKDMAFFRRGLTNILLLFMWFLPITYIYLDNAAYLKADFLKEQTAAWFTVLESELKGVEGYRDEFPVVYIGERAVDDQSLTQMPYFDEITLSGFEQDLAELVNNYAWRAFAERHCGYAPEEIWDRGLYEEMEEVRQMPAYPDKGAIKVINETIVVKFSE